MASFKHKLYTTHTAEVVAELNTHELGDVFILIEADGLLIDARRICHDVVDYGVLMFALGLVCAEHGCEVEWDV